MTEKMEEKARRRAEMIVKVQSGLMTVSEAAKELGVSRNTYYEWQTRGLKGLIEALTDSAPGRPSDPPDSEKEAMQRKLDEMKQDLELTKARLRVRDVLSENPEPDASGRKKKERPGA